PRRRPRRIAGQRRRRGRRRPGGADPMNGEDAAKVGAGVPTVSGGSGADPSESKVTPGSKTSEERRRRRREYEPTRADIHHHLVDAEGMMDRDVTPVDEWRLIEAKPGGIPLGVAETLFAQS